MATKDRAEIRKLMDFPEYREATEKLNRLRGELEETAAEVSRLAFTGKAIGLDVERDRVAAILAEGKYVRAKVFEPDANDKAYAEAVTKKRLLKAAVEEQGRRVHALHHEASRAICKEARPAFVEIIQRMADAFAELCVIADEERRFRDQLLADDVLTSGLRGMAMPAWDISEGHLQARLWFAELEEHFGIRPQAIQKAIDDQNRRRKLAAIAEERKREAAAAREAKAEAERRSLARERAAAGHQRRKAAEE